MGENPFCIEVLIYFHLEKSDFQEPALLQVRSQLHCCSQKSSLVVQAPSALFDAQELQPSRLQRTKMALFTLVSQAIQQMTNEHLSHLTRDIWGQGGEGQQTASWQVRWYFYSLERNLFYSLIEALGPFSTCMASYTGFEQFHYWVDVTCNQTKSPQSQIMFKGEVSQKRGKY